MCCGGLTNVSLFHKTHPSPVSWRTHKEELTRMPPGCRASNTFEVARMQSGRSGWLLCLDKRSKCLLWKSFLSWIFALFIQPIIMMTLMFSKVWDLHFSASACAVKFYWSEAPQYSDSSACDLLQCHCLLCVNVCGLEHFRNRVLGLGAAVAQWVELVNFWSDLVQIPAPPWGGTELHVEVSLSMILNPKAAPDVGSWHLVSSLRVLRWAGNSSRVYPSLRPLSKLDLAPVSPATP